LAEGPPGSTACKLSGPSSRDYLDASTFQQAGIEVQFQQFQYPVYLQLYGDSISGLSIIDLLMNVGPSRAVSYLQNDLVPCLSREAYQS
jgi:hypothetical protein